MFLKPQPSSPRAKVRFRGGLAEADTPKNANVGGMIVLTRCAPCIIKRNGTLDIQTDLCALNSPWHTISLAKEDSREKHLDTKASASTANAAELARNAYVVQASRHTNLVQKRPSIKGSEWPPAKISKKKEAKTLRSEINEAVKLNVPAFANLIELLRQLRHVVAFSAVLVAYIRHHVTLQPNFVPFGFSILSLPLPPRPLDLIVDMDMGQRLPARVDQYRQADLLYIRQHRCFRPALRSSRL